MVQHLTGDASAELAQPLEVREYRADDATAALALRNAVFPPVSLAHWADNQTAAVALLGERLVGVIPFLVRDFEIAPGIVIRGAFANSVAVAEEYRDRGIGTRMLQAAQTFLPRWAEAMFVYTGHERGGPQYRFYARTGHHDLSYPRRLEMTTQPGVATLPAAAAVRSVDAVREIESDLLEVYAQCYSGCAGAPPRHPGFWPRALASHIFVEIPYDAFYLITLHGHGRVQGYAIVGLKPPEVVILECAARGEVAQELWSSAAALARRHDVEQVVLYGQNLNTPLYSSARESGFTPSPRDDVLVGQVIQPEALCARWWSAVEAPPEVTLEVWTPARSVALHQGRPGAPIVRLEMKEALLHQLLLGRVDLLAAVREERITVQEGTKDLVRQIGELLLPAPWVYHHLDYI